MRLFLAINLPSELRSRLYRDTEPLRRAAPDLTWVRSELLHFTAKFLGDVPAEKVENLRVTVGGAVQSHAPFSLTLVGAGAFPNFRRPRVVWIGVKSQRSVFALAEDVEEACELLGFERDARGFTPHLTIGRVKKDLASGTAQALERAALALRDEYVLDIASIDLTQSELTPAGPNYRVLAELPLRGPR